MRPATGASTRSRNIVANGHAGLIFLIPGRSQTLRLNGRACVTARADVLERLSPVGKPPRTAIVIRADEVYTHCPKAFIRSKLWQPESWPDEAAYPSTAEAALAHRAAATRSSRCRTSSVSRRSR